MRSHSAHISRPKNPVRQTRDARENIRLGLPPFGLRNLGLPKQKGKPVTLPKLKCQEDTP
jgi:hypothetical protein